MCLNLDRLRLNNYAITGRTIELSDESLMHTITALSGVLHFYEFIDAFKQFGIQHGLDELTAVHAALGTMLGAAK